MISPTFVFGFPTLVGGVVAGMLCADTLRSTDGDKGSGKTMGEDDKDTVERLSRALGSALDVNLATRTALQRTVGSVDALEVNLMLTIMSKLHRLYELKT